MFSCNLHSDSSHDNNLYTIAKLSKSENWCWTVLLTELQILFRFYRFQHATFLNGLFLWNCITCIDSCDHHHNQGNRLLITPKKLAHATHCSYNPTPTLHPENYCRVQFGKCYINGTIKSGKFCGRFYTLTTMPLTSAQVVALTEVYSFFLLSSTPLYQWTICPVKAIWVASSICWVLIELL